MEKQIVISMDTGNKQIKTEHLKFDSYITESDYLISDDALAMKYKGKYYSSGVGRISYMRDKSMDDRFYWLALLGIVMELDYMKENGLLEVLPDDFYSITLLNGLPPAHLSGLGEIFRNYLARNTMETVVYKNTTYHIIIKKAVIFPQGYSAALLYCGNIKDYEKTIVVDIGGMTVDILTFRRQVIGKSKKFVIDQNMCDSIEKGTIKLFNRLASMFNSKYGICVDANDCNEFEQILLGTENRMLPQNCIREAKKLAETFVQELVDQVAEMVNGLSYANVFFCGGGSLLFKKYIQAIADKSMGCYTICPDEYANVKGYKESYRALQLRTKDGK